MKQTIYLFISILSCVATAQTETKSPWTHESEASVVQVAGNTKSESYSAKQKTTYKMDHQSITATARYLFASASGASTAKAWDAYLRYEKELSDLWSLFLQHGAESDLFAGYIQRDHTDLGAKYYIFKSPPQLLFAELGARYSNLMFTNGTLDYANGSRVYLEYSNNFTETVSGKFWTEHIANFKDSDAYLINYEPSVNVMMNKIFSVKVAYLVKIHNKTQSASEEKQDSTFTTSLVAKF